MEETPSGPPVMRQVACSGSLKDFQLESLKTTIPKEYLKGCGACQFTIGAMYEFLANARTIRALLPSVKKACSSCNSAEEIAKCEALVETHGVAFYQDVLRQASPYKWWAGREEEEGGDGGGGDARVARECTMTAVPPPAELVCSRGVGRHAHGSHARAHNADMMSAIFCCARKRLICDGQLGVEP